MKKVFVALLLLAATAAQAGSRREDCEALASYAKVVMACRQTGVPIGEALSFETKNKFLLDVVEEIVLAAYERPMYRTESYQRQAVIDFENKVMVKCLRAMKRRDK